MNGRSGSQTSGSVANGCACRHEARPRRPPDQAYPVVCAPVRRRRGGHGQRVGSGRDDHGGREPVRFGYRGGAGRRRVQRDARATAMLPCAAGRSGVGSRAVAAHGRRHGRH